MASTPTIARSLVRNPLEASEMLQSNSRWMSRDLLFFATTINYLDRQILFLLKPFLDKELHWTNGNFGWIKALFQDAYAFSFLFFGWSIARCKIKVGYAVSIVAASMAAAVHALATTLFNSGSKVGALLAPALVPSFALAFGWHAASLAAGAAGILWLIAWFISFRDPTEKALAASNCMDTAKLRAFTPNPNCLGKRSFASV